MEESHLNADQQSAITRLFSHDQTLLVAPMGAGKTVCVLTAFKELFDGHVLNRLLVVAPLRVCTEVWATEYLNWGHLKTLGVGIVTGLPAARKAVVEDLTYNILVINFECLPWFFETFDDQHNCDALAIDELTMIKNPGGVQFKALRPRLPDFKWRIGMSGTPVSEDWIGLYGMTFLLDMGRTFGRSKDRFLKQHFTPIDYDQHQWEIKDGHALQLVQAIAPLLHIMPDYRHELPPLDIEEIIVTLSETGRMAYEQMAKDFVLEDLDLEAPNAGVQTAKLQQIASGFVYVIDSVTRLHDRKIRAFEMLMGEVTGPVIVVYQYQAELNWLRTLYPDAPVMKESKGLASTVVRDWNAGNVPVLLMHPRSGGHGLNLAAGGAHMIWIDPCWSRDRWEQTIARLWRRGQRQTVRIQVIVAENTVDELIMARLDVKGEQHGELLEHASA